MAQPLTIEDLRLLAKRRVPRMFYDYADSGAWTEGTYRANETDFAKVKLRQRVAVDMTNRSLASEMIGQPVTMPVAPRCMAAVVRSSPQMPARDEFPVAQMTHSPGRRLSIALSSRS